MTFEALYTIISILFTAEERLIGKKAFYILESWVDKYLRDLLILTAELEAE